MIKEFQLVISSLNLMVLCSINNQLKNNNKNLKIKDK